MSTEGAVVVRGPATPDELAAVLAVVLACGTVPGSASRTSPLDEWRRTRAALLRP